MERDFAYFRCSSWHLPLLRLGQMNSLKVEHLGELEDLALCMASCWLCLINL